MQFRFAQPSNSGGLLSQEVSPLDLCAGGVAKYPSLHCWSGPSCDVGELISFIFNTLHKCSRSAGLAHTHLQRFGFVLEQLHRL